MIGCGFVIHIPGLHRTTNVMLGVCLTWPVRHKTRISRTAHGQWGILRFSLQNKGGRVLVMASQVQWRRPSPLPPINRSDGTPTHHSSATNANCDVQNSKCRSYIGMNVRVAPRLLPRLVHPFIVCGTRVHEIMASATSQCALR